MDNWAKIHRYRRAVANSQAAPIMCPECNSELVPVVGKNGEPALRCLVCRSVYEPGVLVWNQIDAALDNLDDGN